MLAIWFRAFDDGIIFDTTAIAIKQFAASLNKVSRILDKWEYGFRVVEHPIQLVADSPKMSEY